jgi:hypothetical protein
MMRDGEIRFDRTLPPVEAFAVFRFERLRHDLSDFLSRDPQRFFVEENDYDDVLSWLSEITLCWAGLPESYRQRFDASAADSFHVIATALIDAVDDDFRLPSSTLMRFAREHIVYGLDWSEVTIA